MTNPLTPEPQKAAFGAALVVNSTPRVQIQAVHGLTSQVETFSALGGTATTETGEFKVSTGTTIGGFATVLSSRGLRYKPGQGAENKFTCRFTTPAANSLQQSGMINIGNRLVYGYNGLTFGSFHVHGGYAELRLLTVTVASTGATNATVTVDGVIFTVPLTASGVINTTAAELAESLDSQDPLNSYTANQAAIYVRFGIVGPKAGVFAFTHATAAAGWTTIKTGVTPTTDFTAQTDWNIDKMDGTGPSGLILGAGAGGDFDPLAGGFIGRIPFQYLGYGCIQYEIGDPTQISKFWPAHVVQWLKDGNTGPNLSDPGFRTGWVASSQGSTTDLTVRGASAELANQGEYVILEESRSESTEILAAASGVEHHLLTIRNRTHFGGVSNGSEILAILAKFGTESSKGTTFRIYKNVGTWSTNLIYNFVDEAGSIAELSTTTATLSALGGGRLVDTGIKLSVGEGEINLELLRTVVNQSETISITGEISSGAAKDLNGSMTWKWRA